MSYIQVKGRRIRLGYFNTVEEASTRYEAARQEYYPNVFNTK